jgi:hypothetical protein
MWDWLFQFIDPLEQAGWFEKRRSLEIAGRKLWFAAPEVVILHKLIFYRQGGGEKHLRDIAAMIETAGQALDRAWMRAEAARLGLDVPERFRASFAG